MDTKELRAIAQDAHDKDNEWFDVQYLNRFVHFDRAEFIAALSPARVLRMIDVIEKVQAVEAAAKAVAVGADWMSGPEGMPDNFLELTAAHTRCAQELRASLQALKEET